VLSREASVLFRGIVHRPGPKPPRVAVISVDLPSELRIAETLPTGSISLQGEQLLLEAIQPGALRLIADCGQALPLYRLP
jgi:hypothetical protein